MKASVAVLLAGTLAVGSAQAAEAPAEADAAPPVASEPARGYLGFGLVGVSHTYSSPFGDLDSSGGGVVANGAFHSQPINPSLDIAFRGELSIVGREFDGGGPQTGDLMFEVDGGVRISRMLLLTLGYTTHALAYDNPEITFTYGVIPVGLGILHTTDAGYVLAQVRVGGGRLSDDQTNQTEDVGYAGIRAVVQHGFDSGIQFMLGLGLDTYKLDDTDEEEQFFRLEFGLGFGL